MQAVREPPSRRIREGAAVRIRQNEWNRWAGEDFEQAENRRHDAGSRPASSVRRVVWLLDEGFLGSERESDGTATFTQLSSPAEPRGTRRWSPPSAWPSTADTAGSY